MAVDLSVFDRLKTKADYDRESELFQLQKQKAMLAATGQDPAAVKLANEIGKARASGDIQRMNDLLISSKSWDKGVSVDQFGNPVPITGYGDAIGSIEGAKARYKQDQQNISDLSYKPQIEYDTTIQGGRAKNEIEVEAKTAKDQKSAGRVIYYLDMAEGLLPAASSGALGTLTSSVKGAADYSDEKTQADEQLRLISGWLMSNVPRMEGPQSNFDVLNYQKMAADVGNTMKPIKDRLAALKTLKELQEKYMGSEEVDYNSIPRLSIDDLEDPMAASRNAILQRNAEGIQNPNQTLPQPEGQPAAPKKGQRVGDYMFVGGDPSQQSSWKKVK